MVWFIHLKGILKILAWDKQVNLNSCPSPWQMCRSASGIKETQADPVSETISISIADAQCWSKVALRYHLCLNAVSSANVLFCESNGQQRRIISPGSKCWQFY
jgi:hypothetical protein